jgi:beta-lactamase regulating signal transducer with metallopeptidase domain
MNTPLWLSNLLFWSAQIILLVLVAGFLPRLFQIRQPRVLLLYWRALLAISLLLPFVQPWHRAKPIGTIAAPIDLEPVPLHSATSPAVAHWHLPSLDLVAQIFAAVILAGIAVRFVMFALGLLKLRQFRRASSPIPSSAESVAVLEEMGVRANASAEFRLSADVDSPVTFGFLAPVILLPERFPSLDARFQSAIACHELLHVRRRDWAHHLSEEILRAVFWFHPAIAWLIARVRLAREQIVDLEVVKLTNARKPYLEALLAFTNAGASFSAVPAPPFLAERQLAERVALMLKEVRMSRTRLIASLTSIVCFLALTVTFAVWAFPLRAIPRNAQNAPQSGIAGGVSGGVTGSVSQGISGSVSGGVSSGVTGGVSGGIPSRVNSSASADIPTVDLNTVWIDTVKRGPMVRQVRGLGTLVRAKDSTIAKVLLPESMTREVHANQNAVVSTKKGPLATGHVISVSREVVNGTVAVDISLDAVPTSGDTITNLDPHFVGVPNQIDATIDIEKLDNILQIGRPVAAAANSTSSVFKLVKDGTEAVRVNVKFGRSSVSIIEVLDGLKEGDEIILSDMSPYNNADRVHITDEKALSKP